MELELNGVHGEGNIQRARDAVCEYKECPHPKSAVQGKEGGADLSQFDIECNVRTGPQTLWIFSTLQAYL